MKRLYRIRLRPRSAWHTPWQADTLTGLLCWTCSRTEGSSVVLDRLIRPMLEGTPPFVLSDGFPGDLLPVPVVVQFDGAGGKHGKGLKRAQWLTPSGFERARRGGQPSLDDFVAESPVKETVRMRNALGRSSNATGEAGSLFGFQEYRLDHGAPSLAGANWISVYARVEPDCEDFLLAMFSELARTGFGADASAGLGAFDFPDGEPLLEPAVGITDEIESATGVIVLSTFQPGPTDPTVGWWESFTKWAKLGPDLGLADVRKNPLVLLRPGACFQTDPRPVMGRAIDTDELLPPESARALKERGIAVIHPAFGLCVSAALPSS